MSRRAEVLALMGATLIVAVVLIATQPRDVFWGSDSGNRFMQMDSLLRTGSVAVEHRWPIGHHFVDLRGKTYSIWAPAFPVLAAPFFAAFRWAGLFVLPIAGTLLLIALLPMLTEGSVAVNGAVIVLGTPILWYTIVFWEHTLAAAILLAAFLLAERRRPLLAGALAGCSTLLREEGYIAIASIVIAILLTRRGPRQAILFVIGALVPLIPLWVINANLFGNPVGLHAAVYSSIAQGGRLSNFFPYLFEFSSRRLPAIALVIPAIALILTSPLRMRDSFRVSLFALASIGFAILTFLLLHSAAPIRETLYNQGLFPAVPFSAAMFLSIPQLWSERRMRLVTVLVAIVLTTLLVNQSDFGVTWGPRYYLWLLPLMIVLGAESVGRLAASHLVVGCAVVLLACSFTIQFEGIRILRSKLRFSERVLDAVRADPAPLVITDVFWIPEDLAAAFYDKQFGLVRNDRELADALQAAGTRPILFIAARQFRLISDPGFAPMLTRVTRRRRIAGIDPMLDVMLLDVRPGP